MYLYREEASWAAIGTNLANRSGPVTVGSVGLTGKALTSGAPEENRRLVSHCITSFFDEKKSKYIYSY